MILQIAAIDNGIVCVPFDERSQQQYFRNKSSAPKLSGLAVDDWISYNVNIYDKESVVSILGVATYHYNIVRIRTLQLFLVNE